MARGHAYYEIYFTGVPKEIDGGYCCIKVRMGRFDQRAYHKPEQNCWNDHRFYTGQRAYTAIRNWAKFVGLTPVIYADGTVSKYTYNLPWEYSTFLIDIAQKELEAC